MLATRLRRTGRRQKITSRRPVACDLLRQLVADVDPQREADVPDGALRCSGFGAALRRSELVTLDGEDLAFVAARVGRSPPARHTAAEPLGRRQDARG